MKDGQEWYRVWEDNGSLFENCIAENVTLDEAKRLQRIAPAHIKRRYERQYSYIEE